MKRAILFIVLLVQPGRAASSQVAPHNLNKPVDIEVTSQRLQARYHRRASILYQSDCPSLMGGTSDSHVSPQPKGCRKQKLARLSRTIKASCGLARNMVFSFLFRFWQTADRLGLVLRRCIRCLLVGHGEKVPSRRSLVVSKMYRVSKV
jgi:hypothetical protein